MRCLIKFVYYIKCIIKKMNTPIAFRIYIYAGMQ